MEGSRGGGEMDVRGKECDEGEGTPPTLSCPSYPPSLLKPSVLAVYAIGAYRPNVDVHSVGLVVPYSFALDHIYHQAPSGYLVLPGRGQKRISNFPEMKRSDKKTRPPTKPIRHRYSPRESMFPKHRSSALPGPPVRNCVYRTGCPPLTPNLTHPPP